MKLVSLQDPILRQKAESVSNIDQYIKDCMIEMYDLMVVSGGIGLAAPQVGIGKRMIVIDAASEGLIQVIPKSERKKLFMINPLIISFYGNDTYAEEGCLSVPEKTIMVPRKQGIICHYYDLDNQKKIIRTDSFLSRIIQHECDHLDGKLIIDYA